MTKVKADISISLDGFIEGARGDVDRLHQWVYELESWREAHGMEGGETGSDSDVLAEIFENTGAVLMGRTMFDVSEEPWGDEPPFRMPVFVLTHRPRETLVKQGGTTFHFVTDGLESALAQARAVAGEKDVAVAGGASIFQQLIKAGLLDEIQVHVVPVLLGAGTRLFGHLDAPFELECSRVLESPVVTHLRYRVVRA
jgi:dihydrofolate reductase